MSGSQSLVRPPAQLFGAGAERRARLPDDRLADPCVDPVRDRVVGLLTD
jgi:hypothetical protein